MNAFKKSFTKTIAVFLAAVMLVYVVPTRLLAVEESYIYVAQEYDVIGENCNYNDEYPKEEEEYEDGYVYEEETHLQREILDIAPEAALADSYRPI